MNALPETIDLDQGEIAEKHLNGKRPYGSCPRTEKLLIKLSALSPEISAVEKRCAQLRDYIAQRSTEAASGKRGYPSDSRDLDGQNLMHEESRLQGLLERRSKLEAAVKDLHMKRLLPVFDQITNDMAGLAIASKPHAMQIIESYQTLRESLRQLANLERRHQSRREEAGRIRGMTASLDSEHSPTLRGAEMPCSATDLLSRLIDGIRSYTSTASVYNIRVADYPGLGEEFTFDDEPDDEDATEA